MSEQIVETKNCVNCGIEYSIIDKDMEFYDKISPIFDGRKFQIPVPTHCPDCRQQRRLAFRNERQLYSRKCDATGKSIVSTYHQDQPFPVYSLDYWMGDEREALDYGRDYDFNRSFFEQFHELNIQVPKIALIFDNNENCDFTNGISDSKNCYLIFGSTACEDCYYGSPYHCEDCVDSLVLRDSKHCYECIDSEQLFDCKYCQNCDNCSNIIYGYELSNCKDCIACAGLKDSQYCILNEQHSKEDFLEFQVSSYKLQDNFMKKFEELKKAVVHKYYTGKNNEKVSGNFIFNSGNSNYVFHTDDLQDGKYLTYATHNKDLMDCDNGEYSNLLYENCGYFKISKSCFGLMNWVSTDNIYYCNHCAINVHYCFGCTGLHNKSYCILNKQYSKEEYEKLVPKIIEQMKETGERGEYFPINISLYGYNETSAQDYFPLTKEEAESKGFNRMAKEIPINIPEGMETIEAEDLKELQVASDKVNRTSTTDNIKSDCGSPQEKDKINKKICAGQDVLDKAIICEETGKPFRLIKPELDFYIKHNIELPRKHPEVRMRARLAKRPENKLKDRKCSKCEINIQTAYDKDKYKVVYCEKCYDEEVY